MGDFVTHYRHSLQPVEFARERLGIPLDARQAEVLGVSGNRVLLNCCRQWGKSTITAAMAVHRAFFRKKSLVVVLSPTARQSAEFLRKAAEFVKVLGISPRGDGDNAISLVFPNGSRIVGLPGTEGTVRGFSKVSLMIIDEAARVADELYYAAEPMTAVGDGDLWLMSTPFGRRGFYWKEWNRPDRWMRVSVPATECPRLSAKHLEHVRESMPDSWFRQEYMCEFGDDEKCLFSREILERAVRNDVAALDFQFHWHYPSSEWFVAVDLGQKQDFTAIVALERMVRVLAERDPVTFAWKTETLYQVRQVERIPLGTSYVDVVERVREIVTSGPLAGRCKLVVDATGVGGPVVDMLKKAGLGCELIPVMITGGGKESRVNGEWRVPKRDLVAAMQILFEGDAVRIAQGLKEAQALVGELATMRMKVSGEGHDSYGAPDGGREHDDLAVALGLACWRGRKAW